MTPAFLAVYDYLSFVIPGGVIMSAFWYAALWPRYQEPGAFLALVLIVVAFVVGHAVAAVRGWLEPLAWGHRPWTRIDRTWGLIGRRGAYSEADRGDIEGVFEARYSAGRFSTNYDMGYSEIRGAGKTDLLEIFNRQIGFYGNTSVAFFLGAAIVCVGMWHQGVTSTAVVWAASFALAGCLFAIRYKRFWRRFGDEVVRQVRLLAKSETPVQAETSERSQQQQRQ